MRNVSLIICALFVIGCGSKKAAPDAAPVEQQEEVVATTDAPEQPNDPNQLPPPPDVEGPPPTAESSPSGLSWIILKAGDGGASPRPENVITVHYTGWQTNGQMFDSSVVRGEPITFELYKLIPGWIEGIQLMTRGEKRRLWIPAESAYGLNPAPGQPSGMLVFDVELIDFVE